MSLQIQTRSVAQETDDAHRVSSRLETSELRRRRPAIVAVDDEPAMLAAVARDLRRRFGDQYRIVRARSGEEALEALRARRARRAGRRAGGRSAHAGDVRYRLPRRGA